MKNLLIWFLFPALIGLSGCGNRSETGSTTAPAPQTASKTAVVEVLMKNMQFSPSKIEINRGDTIEWKNEDITPHTATSPDFGDSGSLAKGETWRHTFNETGRFPYVCTFHPTMKGTVTVQ